MKKLIIGLGLSAALIGQSAYAGQGHTRNDDIWALLLAGAVTTVIVASALDDSDKVRVEHHRVAPPPPPPRWGHAYPKYSHGFHHHRYDHHRRFNRRFDEERRHRH